MNLNRIRQLSAVVLILVLAVLSVPVFPSAAAVNTISERAESDKNTASPSEDQPKIPDKGKTSHPANSNNRSSSPSELEERGEISLMMASPGEAIYHPGDIAVINEIIRENGLDWTEADPADGSAVPSDWTGVTWSDDIKDRRITSLSLIQENLTGQLDVTSLTSLYRLNVRNNRLEILNVSGLSALVYLNCSDNILQSLNLTSSDNLRTLYCSNNNLPTLDVTAFVQLKTLYCDDNQLQILDISSLHELESLSCSNNNLRTLAVDHLSKLKTLHCSNNQLDSLSILNMHELTVLVCDGNNLTSLDLSGLSSIRTLSCTDNQITELEIPAINKLEYLHCNNNQLKTLDLRNAAKLQRVFCYDNKLQSLTLSGLDALWQLKCNDNELLSLDLSGLNNLRVLDCRNNKISTIDLSAYNTTVFINFQGGNNPLNSFISPYGNRFTFQSTTGGSVIFGRTYTEGSNSGYYDSPNGQQLVELTPIPDSGYRFKEWQIIEGDVTTRRNSFYTTSPVIVIRAVFELSNNTIVDDPQTVHRSNSSSRTTSHWTSDSNGNWIYYTSDGSRLTNTWKLLGYENTAHWYYFDGNGIMLTGWFLDHDGNWYYLNPLSDGTRGAMITGWLTDPQDRNRYYLEPESGKLTTGWRQIDGVWYYFNETGSVVSGWKQNPAAGTWYYENGLEIPLGALEPNRNRE